MTISPSRRTIVKGAAWSAPVLTAAAVAPSLAASPACETTYQTVTKSFPFTASGIVPVTVTVTATIPATIAPGGTANPVQVRSVVTFPANVNGLVRQSIYAGTTAFIGPAADEAEGTSVSTTQLSGVINTTSVTNLTIERQPLATSGEISIVAEGVGAAPLVVPAGVSGTVIMTLQPPASTIVGYQNGTKSPNTYSSPLSPSGDDYTLGSFTIGC